MSDSVKRYVLLAGDPLSGLDCYGPFGSKEAAERWGDRELDDETWWVTDLHEKALHQPQPEESA